MTLPFLLSLVPDAAAMVWTGSPVVGFRIDRPAQDLIDGEVELDKLTVHACDGADTDYTIGEVIDPMVGYELTITGGDLCSVTWHFSTILELDGVGYALEADDASVMSLVSPSIPWVPLTDVEVVSGSMTGSGPALLTWLD